jgi:hypothetical protein
MKRVITVALLGATTSLMALGGEQAYLYKDPRVMGMGGANVAVGAYSSSVFSNPAGLTNIKKTDGFVVDLLSIGVTASDKTMDFIDDIDAAGSDSAKIEDVIDKYTGDAFHLGVNNYSSISKNSDAFAWSIGLLAATDVSFMVHGNSSASGAPIEATGRVYGGLMLGAAVPYETEIGTFDVGIGLKYITQKSYEGPLYVSDLTQDDAINYLKDHYEKTSSGFGVDLGVTYKPFNDNYWHPTIGLSVLNLGSMSMDDNYGGQPTTINLGFSLTPDVSFVNKLVLAVDYVDLLNENIVRVYKFDQTTNSTSYTDYEDSDTMKRLRLGVGMGLIDSSYFSLTLNGGIYQNAYTAGVEMDILIFKINAATYQEQLGTGSVDITDRRYMAQIAIGW